MCDVVFRKFSFSKKSSKKYQECRTNASSRPSSLLLPRPKFAAIRKPLPLPQDETCDGSNIYDEVYDTDCMGVRICVETCSTIDDGSYDCDCDSGRFSSCSVCSDPDDLNKTVTPSSSVTSNGFLAPPPLPRRPSNLISRSRTTSYNSNCTEEDEDGYSYVSYSTAAAACSQDQTTWTPNGDRCGTLDVKSYSQSPKPSDLWRSGSVHSLDFKVTDIGDPNGSKFSRDDFKAELLCKYFGYP